jgi:hypothetical protein
MSWRRWCFAEPSTDHDVSCATTGMGRGTRARKRKASIVKLNDCRRQMLSCEPKKRYRWRRRLARRQGRNKYLNRARASPPLPRSVAG